MKQSTYDWIWEQVEDSIVSVEDGFAGMQPERWNFHRTYGSNTKAVIHREYCKIRDKLKSRCYNERLDRDIRLDHHKIASCFCSALLNKKVFSFRIDDDIPPQILLCNYTLAYTVSLRIVYIYMIDAYEQLGDAEAHDFAEMLRNNQSLLPPETTVSHDQYHQGRVKMLALNEFYHIEFDLLNYAGNMFWIELYNRQKIEGRVDPRPLHNPKRST